MLPIKSVASILSTFTKLIEKLEAVKKRQEDKQEKITKSIEAKELKLNQSLDEVRKANEVIGKLKALTGESDGEEGAQG